MHPGYKEEKRMNRAAPARPSRLHPLYDSYSIILLFRPWFQHNLHVPHRRREVSPFLRVIRAGHEAAAVTANPVFP